MDNKTGSETTHNTNSVTGATSSTKSEHTKPVNDAGIVLSAQESSENMSATGKAKDMPVNVVRSTASKGNSETNGIVMSTGLSASNSNDMKNSNIHSTENHASNDKEKINYTSNQLPVVILQSIQTRMIAVTEAFQKEIANLITELNTKLSRCEHSIADLTAPRLDASMISTILKAEKDITHKKMPMKGGPTAQAQKHVGELINSINMHDITDGEKLITGSDQITKGGPTAILQRAMATHGGSKDEKPTATAVDDSN